MRQNLIVIDRFRGCLVGLALGDALGAPYEFRAPPFEVEPDFGVGVFGTAPGHPTDDTALALRLAQSIVEQGAFVPSDYANKLVGWARSGPPDIGGQTATAARAHAEGRAPAETDSAGNGSLMAIAPLALLTAGADPATRVASAHRFADLTHPNPDVRATNAAFCDAVTGCLRDAEVAVAERPIADPSGPSMGWCRLTYALATETLAVTRGPGDAVPALLGLIALGGDTDTNATVAGALLGARWGMEAWPDDMVGRLAAAVELIEHAERIHELATQSPQ